MTVTDMLMVVRLIIFPANNVLIKEKSCPGRRQGLLARTIVLSGVILKENGGAELQQMATTHVIAADAALALLNLMIICTVTMGLMVSG
jgi:hypothetical protein